MGTETFTNLPSLDDMEFESSWGDSPQLIPQEQETFTEISLSPREETVIFDRKWNEEKRIRRMENVQMFTGGYLHGRYFHNGVGQRNKKNGK